jgi:hypothetical protein
VVAPRAGAIPTDLYEAGLSTAPASSVYLLYHLTLLEKVIIVLSIIRGVMLSASSILLRSNRGGPAKPQSLSIYIFTQGFTIIRWVCMSISLSP